MVTFPPNTQPSPTLADQLAPLATKPKPTADAWRALMKPSELAAFDRGDYKSSATVPRDSDRVSRNNREVRLEKIANETPSAEPTPEEQASTGEVIRALNVIAAISRPCCVCGVHLPGKGEPRVTVMTGDRVFLYCQVCFDALDVKLEADDWFAKLPELERKIWHLLTLRLPQAQIAARLTNGSQRVSQQMVSATKSKIAELIRENLHHPKYGPSIQ